MKFTKKFLFVGVLLLSFAGASIANAQVAPTGSVSSIVPSQSGQSMGKYQTVTPGIPVKISWSFVNVSSCFGSGELNSKLPYDENMSAFDQANHQVNGSTLVSPTALGPHTYSVTCTGATTGGISDSAVVTVIPNFPGGPVDAPSYSMSRTAFNFKMTISADPRNLWDTGGSDTQLGNNFGDDLLFVNKVGAQYRVTASLNTPPNGWKLNVQNKSWDAASATWIINSVDPTTAPSLSGNSVVSVSAQHTYGVPYVAGQYNLGNVTITAANMPGSPFVVPITLTVTGNPTTPTSNLVIPTTSPLPDATVGNSYSTTVSVTGGAGAYTWGTSLGSIPPGLTYTYQSQSGDLSMSGVPTTAGTYTFSLTVTNGTKSVTKQFTLTVAPSTTLPTLAITYPQEGVGYNAIPSPLKWENSIPMNLNTSYSVQMKVVKAVGYSAGDILFTTTLSNVQAGCSNSDVCSYPLTWSLPGTYTIIVKNLGNNASRSVTFTVISPLSTPTLAFSRDAFTATYVQGSPLPTSSADSPYLYSKTQYAQTLTVTNTSSAAISFVITVPNQPTWLNTGYATYPLTVEPGKTMDIGAYLDPATVADKVGTYTTNIILTGKFYDSPKVVPVTLNVVAATTAPVISGGSGPQTLNVNQGGTWTIKTSGNTTGNLSYSVNWGDVPLLGATATKQVSPASQQTATFTHAYQQAGVYTPVFTVTADNGQSAKMSLSVTVGGAHKSPIECEYARPPEGYHWEGMKPYPICGGHLVKDASTVLGCVGTNLFSSLTGQRCDSTTTTNSSGNGTTPLPVDVDTQKTQGACLDIQNNLRYRSRDADTNNEVSAFQDFLQTNNYLNSEPTGFFGLMTMKAAKAFQQASGISPTGFIGFISRAKIKAMTCQAQ